MSSQAEPAPGGGWATSVFGDAQSTAHGDASAVMAVLWRHADAGAWPEKAKAESSVVIGLGLLHAPSTEPLGAGKADIALFL